jgi:predicted component of type VI protein secretion system
VLRIGRSAGNDIVLEDAGKGVSRQHAEIRPGDGGYALVDLDSQNGIWVGGSRVATVRLAPGVAAAVGPYRLTVPEEVAAAPTPEDANEPEPTEYIAGDARTVAGVGGLLDPPVESSPVAPTSPPPSPPAAVERATGASTVKPAPRDGAASTVRSPSSAKTAGGKSRLGVFAAAVLMVVAVAVGSYELVLHKRTPKPVWSRDAAVALVNQGRCQDAMQQQIGPALAAHPNDPEALALKARCAPPPPPPAAPNPTPAPPPPDPTAQALDAVEASLANVGMKAPAERSTECQSDLDAVNAVLANAPDNARAHGLQTKAQDCVKAATPAKPATPAVAKAISPADGGLEVKPGETQADYNRRVQDMKKQYDDAVDQLQGQHYLVAQRAFDAIAAAVPAGYRELAQRRSEVQKTMHEESQRQLIAAQQAEQKGDYAGALQHFQRVHDLDPSHDVSADTTRINDAKLRAGQEACKNGEANFTVGRNAEAAPLLLKATQLLPESDSCYQKAKQHLAQINGR